MKTDKQIFDEVSKSHDRSWKRDRTLWTLRFKAAALTTQAFGDGRLRPDRKLQEGED